MSAGWPRSWRSYPPSCWGDPFSRTSNSRRRRHSKTIRSAHNSWTLTDRDLPAAVEGDAAGARTGGDDEGAGAAFGDMPVHTAGLVPGVR